MSRTNAIPVLKALFAVLVWGASFIATKIAVREVHPLTVVWLRFAIGVGVLLAAISLRKQFALPTRRELLYFTGLGFMGVTFHHWVQSTALVTSQASTASWIIAATPVFIALFAWIFLKERMGRLGVFGVALAALGVLLVVSKGDIISLFVGKSYTSGDLLLLTNPPNWALFTVVSRWGLRRHPAARMMFYVMVIGWVLTTIIFLAGPGPADIARLSLNGWLAVGFLGVLCTGLGYIFWYDALEVMPASQLGVFQYIQPLIAVIVAAIVLGEPLLLASLLGGAIILLGVYLVNRGGVRDKGKPARAAVPVIGEKRGGEIF